MASAPLIDCPPSKWTMAAELPRAIWSVTSHAFSRELLAAAPRGDGRPVLTLPGLFVSDRSNFVMRRYLDTIGYRAFGWDMGHNFSLRTIGPEGGRLRDRIATISEQAGEPVTLVGVSLGGIMARLAAHRWPELVREVITVASPFAGSPRATNLWRPYQWLTGERVDDPAIQAMLAESAAPLTQPCTAIWSASDGLVNGLACHIADDGNCRCIEVQSSHMGVHLKPEVLRAIADVLGGAPTPVSGSRPSAAS